jgi:hypothetical protein
VAVPDDVPAIEPVLKSKRWDAAVATYNKMVEQATEVEEVSSRPIWVGFKGWLMDELGFDRGRSTQIFYDLTRIGSVEILDEGKRSKKSKVVLAKSPNEEEFLDFRGGDLGSIKKLREHQKLQEEMSLLERIQRLEETQKIIITEMQRHFEETHQ